MKRAFNQPARRPGLGWMPRPGSARLVRRKHLSVNEDRIATPTAVALTEVPGIADPAPLGLGRLRADHIPALGVQRRLDDPLQRPGLGRLRARLRRPVPAAGRHVGVPQPERVRRDRVLHLRRLLDRPVPLLPALRGQAGHPRAHSRPVRQGRGLDPARLRHLQHLHADLEHPGQPGCLRRVPDPGGDRDRPVRRELRRQREHREGRRLRRVCSPRWWPGTRRRPGSPTEWAAGSALPVGSPLLAPRA